MTRFHSIKKRREMQVLKIAIKIALKKNGMDMPLVEALETISFVTVSNIILNKL